MHLLCHDYIARHPIDGIGARTSSLPFTPLASATLVFCEDVHTCYMTTYKLGVAPQAVAIPCGIRPGTAISPMFLIYSPVNLAYWPGVLSNAGCIAAHGASPASILITSC